MRPYPRFYCFYSKDQVEYENFGDADIFVHKEDYDDMRADATVHFLKINELQNKLEIAVKALEHYTFEINNAYQAQNALNKIKDK